MIRTPSRLRRTPPIAPFHFATEGELAATLGTTEGELAATIGILRVCWLTHPLPPITPLIGNYS